MKWTVVLPVLAGVLVVMQLSLASVAQRAAGPAAMVLISGLSSGVVGGAALLILPRPEVSARVLWYAIGAGVLGAFIIGSMAVATAHIGLARALALIIASQLILGLVADRLGLFGVIVQDIGWIKPAGVALIIVGAVMVTRS
ncbi:MAG: DMT family transporter [Actinomycetota bacterium]|nr:DMT family transporter [Actinomycetota bacterium]